MSDKQLKAGAIISLAIALILALCGVYKLVSFNQDRAHPAPIKLYSLSPTASPTRFVVATSESPSPTVTPTVTPKTPTPIPATSTPIPTLPPSPTPTPIPFLVFTETRRIPYWNEFVKTGNRFGLNPVMMARQAEMESGFNPNAVGKGGELGLMQIMPSTFSYMACRYGDCELNPLDPSDNILVAGFLLAYLRERCGGWGDPSKGCMILAYAVGEGNAADFYQGGGESWRNHSFSWYIEGVLGDE